MGAVNQNIITMMTGRSSEITLGVVNQSVLYEVNTTLYNLILDTMAMN